MRLSLPNTVRVRWHAFVQPSQVDVRRGFSPLRRRCAHFLRARVVPPTNLMYARVECRFCNQDDRSRGLRAAYKRAQYLVPETLCFVINNRF